jgi:hypothetical protein
MAVGEREADSPSHHQIRVCLVPKYFCKIAKFKKECQHTKMLTTTYFVFGV